MKFKTESGSTYEVNTETKQIRRVNGMNDPTPRVGKQGEWRPYVDLFPQPIKVGNSVIICWGKDVELLPETKKMIENGELDAVPTTMTSCVVEIEET